MNVQNVEINKSCIFCGKEFVVKKFGRKDAKCCSSACNTRWWYSQNKKRAYEYNKQYLSLPEKRKIHNKTRRIYQSKKRKEFRQKIIAKFGGKCIQCGFNDWRALQVDHVNGGGTQEVKIVFNRNRDKYNQSLLKDKSNKYQLLCANCNWIKKYEKDENANDKRRLI